MDGSAGAQTHERDQVLYILLRFVVRYKTVFLWRHVPLAFFSLALPVFCYFQLSKAAKATYDNGELLDGGADLNAGGIPGYLQDGIWVTVAVQFLTVVISDWFWFLYLLPVAFAIWKMGGFLWPMLMPSHSQEAEETPDERRKRDKKQSKAERAEKRGKMKVRR
eukprot:jgi/Astpho2/7463/Aster-x1435